MSQFSLSLPSLPELHLPDQLMQVVQCCSEPETQLLLTVDKVIIAIQNDQAEKISLLEWIYCLQSKAEWDRSHSEQSINSAQAIWRIAIQHQSLRHRLLWRLALYRSGQKEAIAVSLAETFSTFKNASQTVDKLIIQILDALLSSNPGREAAKIACQFKLTHSELIQKLGHAMPTSIPVFQAMVEEISPYFVTLKQPNTDQVDWLLRCFKQMSEPSQVRAVDYLLIHLPVNTGNHFTSLATWLKENYAWVGHRAKWAKLTDPAKAALRSWIGSVNYGDFKNLINQLLRKLTLLDYERNRLERRRDFWENYSDRFSDIRILMPQESVNVLDYKAIDPVDVLLNDGSDPAEICIFDFGKWLIVEFFRGTGGEIRLFENKPQMREFLFATPNLSIKRIRAQGGTRLDHEYLWQHECETCLRNRDILPNKGVVYFKGLENLPKYSFETGLPKPSLDKWDQRRHKHKRWQEEIERLELEARRWCSNKQF